MFSSLPSASKIYVSSCKPRTKNSAKKKRKKVVASTSTPVRAYDEETLVSSISLRKGSASHLSLNSNEESLEIELNSKSDEVLNISEEIVEENTNSIKNTERDHEENNSTESINETKKSPNFIHGQSRSTETDHDENMALENVTEDQNLTNVISDSIYCDEYSETDICETKEIQESHVESTESMVEISTRKSSMSEEHDDALSIPADINVHEKDTSTSIQVMTEDSSVQTLADDEVLSKDLVLITPKEIYDQENNIITENIDNEILVHNEIDSHSTFPSDDDANLNDETNEEFLENSCENKDERASSDNSSVKSDCCAATNLFDIHVDNSEHSSLNENQNSGGDHDRLHSPEQSEVSCTESIMYDTKSAYQNESPFQSSSGFEEELCKRSILKNSSQKRNSNTNDLPKKVLDTSNSVTDLHKVKSGAILRRSLSLPEEMCNSKTIELFSNEMYKKTLAVHRSNFDNYINKSNKSLDASDKSTFTIDMSVVTSDKSTLTSSIESPTHCRIDAATTPFGNGSETPRENKRMSLKDSAVLVMNVLPPVAIMQARARSYVVGSVGATQSLLGNEELSRFFPDKRVTVFVGTWNMNGHDPPECIDDFILPLDVSSMPDIYAVGIQESMQSRSDWEILLQTTLGPSHVLFASTSFGVLHLSIFMRRDLIWFCSEPEEANIATRPGSMIKTKGAVAICFMFFGTSFLFVNSHLTAHEQKLKERLSDYEKICSALDLPKQIPLKPHQRSKDVTSRFDCVFWCGDLNFRVIQDRPSVLSFVEKFKSPEPSCNLLMKHDQLTQSMAKGDVFHGFNEGVINFIPSYKFDVGTSCFDSAKQRVPSYTDRILYRSSDKSSVICVHYDAVSEIFTSDHKPVFAVFKVSIKPGRDNIPLAAGLFKRDIYLEAIKRRAQQLEVARNHKQSTICNVM